MYMKKDIKQFLIASFIVIIGVALIDILVGVISDKLVDKLPNFAGQFAKDNYRLHRMNEDIVIIGSSRGSHHYVTNQLGDSINNYLGKSFSIYNAAIDGKFASSNSCAAEVIIDRYKPKMVIFDISEGQLKGENVDDIKFSSPFYWKDSIVRRYIDNIGFKEKVITKSSLYRYNGKFVRIFSSFIQAKNIDDGYLPLYGTSIDTNIMSKKSNPKVVPFNDYKYNNFENVLKKYSQHDIPLIVVASPYFRPSDDNKELKLLCNKYNIPFINIYNNTYFNNHPELFKDEGHLNDVGAHYYTALFFNYLKPYLYRIR